MEASAATTAAASAVSLPHLRRSTRGAAAVQLPLAKVAAAGMRLQNVDLTWSSKSRSSLPMEIGEVSSRFCCRCKQPGVLGTEMLHESVDEALILKRKAQEVVRHLCGRCIYLVGMMGSGKSTVGKILSEVLGYSYFDSDKLVEQAVGMDSVAEIFKQYSEAFFRDSESEVLRDLSSMRRLVVATGGGAVVRPINWKYMRQGVTVWLDVPLEALARRIAAVGTASRPLLHGETGDPYTKALERLSALAEQRGEAYANADARVCLQHMADKKCLNDVCALTPTDIAIEALIKIENMATKDVTHTTRDSSVRQHSYLRG